MVRYKRHHYARQLTPCKPIKGGLKVKMQFEGADLISYLGEGLMFYNYDIECILKCCFVLTLLFIRTIHYTYIIKSNLIAMRIYNLYNTIALPCFNDGKLFLLNFSQINDNFEFGKRK